MNTSGPSPSGITRQWARATTVLRYAVVAASVLSLALAVMIGDARHRPSGSAPPVAARAAGPNYPESTFVTSVHWGRQIVQAGCGDNVPTTWGANGAIFAAVGDCGGFARSPASTTVVRIEDIGNPLLFAGRNIWQLEEPYGMRGRKISGLLGIGGVLYAMLRNADHRGKDAQIAYSRDDGRSWTFAPWLFEVAMGYPTFVNFGEDGAGGSDRYVYIVSPDTESAYQPSPDPARQGMVLLRVPQGDLLDQGAYEYFAGLVDGSPRWSGDPLARRHVFECRVTRCLRSQISYDAGIGRFLWWQQAFLGSADTRYSGGFGVYEAPALWGPWRTVYWTADSRADPSFADAPGDGGSFPTKWMSEDGRGLALVCSCENAFTVRRLELFITSG